MNKIKFEDQDVRKLDLDNPNDFSNLFIKYLCGKQVPDHLKNELFRMKIKKIIKGIKQNGLNYEQFNEILLIHIQNRVSRGFFNYFFSSVTIDLKKLKIGVEIFRGYSLLHFGNFKFTYRNLSEKNSKEIEDILGSYKEIPKSVYCNRLEPVLNLNRIKKEKVYLLGYLSVKIFEKEFDLLEKVVNNEGTENQEELEQYKSNMVDLKKFHQKMLKTREDITKIKSKGIENTQTLLIWDYMDIYIATSMRTKGDFEETYDFLTELTSNKEIKKLNLRIFDPTQSYCNFPKDKSLIEGLMLKRAKCNIYMVQESDTIGKDSELAATLAQKKTVVAFIPDYSINDLEEKMKNYSLDSILNKIFKLKAEGVFEDVYFIESINEIRNNEDIINFNRKIYSFVEKVEKYKINQPFSLWVPKIKEFINSIKSEYNWICNVLALATKRLLDRRADLLKKFHPLSMQIDLNSGVANGVIVVRDLDKCIDVLIGILTNSLEFEIYHCEENYTGLFEKQTGSLYRLITDDEEITNSFWNFFYKK